MTKSLFDTSTPAQPGLRLQSLRTRNFKGLKKFDLEPKGNDIDVHGDNATGKTTLFDAYLWLLFGKDSQNQAAFNIKTLDKDNQPLRNLDHSAEAYFALDGKSIVLKKEYKEVWTKPRGQKASVLTGHTTDHFFDGVPLPQGEYNTRLARLFEEEIFRLLSDPTHFNENLPWQKRREILIEVCGDVTDEDVVASSDALQELGSLLSNHNIEDLKAILASRKKKIAKRLIEIPIQIKENQRSLTDEASFDANLLSKLKRTRKKKASELSRVKHGGGIAEKEKELAEIESERFEIEVAARRKQEDVVNAARSKLRKAQNELSDLQAEEERLERSLAVKHAAKAEYADSLESWRASWVKASEQEFTFEDGAVCPTCGQDLPEEQVEDARQKALEAFNIERANLLHSLQQKGEKAAKALSDIEADIADGETALKSVTTKAAAAERVVDKAKVTLNKIPDVSPDLTKHQRYNELGTKRESLRLQIEALKQDASSTILTIEKELSILDAGIEELEREKAALEAQKKMRTRIGELEAEEEALSLQLEECEKHIYLAEEFTKTKVNMLEEKIQSKFGLARFKMFHEHLSGGIKETCETLVDGVPYKDLNRGAKLNVGLDIIRTLQKHYGFECPVWIDNAEAVTKLIPMNCQIIRLVVDGNEKELKVKEAK